MSKSTNTVVYFDWKMSHTIYVPITTKVLSSNLIHGEVYWIQHYVVKFVIDLRQVDGFLRFPPSIKLTATI